VNYRVGQIFIIKGDRNSDWFRLKSIEKTTLFNASGYTLLRQDGSELLYSEWSLNKWFECIDTKLHKLFYEH